MNRVDCAHPACFNYFGVEVESTDTGTVSSDYPLEAEAVECGWSITYSGTRCPKHKETL